MNSPEKKLRFVRILIAIVILGLIGSGLSTFPLLRESARLEYWANKVSAPAAVTAWTSGVHSGLEKTYEQFPWIAYGTDWLGFGHFVIALFVIGALVDPVRNIWIIRASMIACLLVIPMALICGAARGIPLWWRAIDCSFGIFGLIPLWLAERMIRKLPVHPTAFHGP